MGSVRFRLRATAKGRRILERWANLRSWRARFQSDPLPGPHTGPRRAVRADGTKGLCRRLLVRRLNRQDGFPPRLYRAVDGLALQQDSAARRRRRSLFGARASHNHRAGAPDESVSHGRLLDRRLWKILARANCCALSAWETVMVRAYVQGKSLYAMSSLTSP